MKQNLKNDNDYPNLIQKELLIKRNQLNSLIKQSTLLGRYYEEIVRDTLMKFIPDKFSLGTGIIAYGEKSSTQLDIIIYDNTISYPIFSTKNMIIIEPKAVNIILEVKSEITTRKLNDAIKTLRSAIDVFNLPYKRSIQPKLETIIIGFSSDMKISTLEKRCKENGIDQIIILSKRSGEIIPDQFKSLINNLTHCLEYRQKTQYHKSLLFESQYLQQKLKDDS